MQQLLKDSSEYWAGFDMFDIMMQCGESIHIAVLANTLCRWGSVGCYGEQITPHFASVAVKQTKADNLPLIGLDYLHLIKASLLN